MIRLVTYSDESMSISRQKCRSSFLHVVMSSKLDHNGITIHEWDRQMIEATEFYQLNKEILDTPRGSGLWAWKSYIIYKAMLDMADGDILVYSDAGVEFINDVSHIINVMDEDVFLFTNGFKQVHWCKGDTMDAILPDWRDGRYDDRMQVQASNIFIRVSNKSKEFVKTWLMFCQMPGLISDSPSLSDNHKEFAAHREDQSILCALQIKYGYQLHWFPTTTAHHLRHHNLNDKYPTTLLHHRKRNHEW